MIYIMDSFEAKAGLMCCGGRLKSPHIVRSTIRKNEQPPPKGFPALRGPQSRKDIFFHEYLFFIRFTTVLPLSVKGMKRFALFYHVQGILSVDHGGMAAGPGAFG
ncbi:MAG: hypothetical protein R2874_10990 [Desulfobacterales bacterium]